jgi:hypothetical protein
MNLYNGKRICIKTKEELLKTPGIIFDSDNVFYMKGNSLGCLPEMYNQSRRIAVIEDISNVLFSSNRLQFHLINKLYLWEPWMIEDSLIVMLEALT